MKTTTKQAQEKAMALAGRQALKTKHTKRMSSSASGMYLARGKRVIKDIAEQRERTEEAKTNANPSSSPSYSPSPDPREGCTCIYSSQDPTKCTCIPELVL